MAYKRLLYLTAQQLRVYSWTAGKLIAEASFDAGDAGTAEFAHFLATSPGSLYYLVPDVIEEDFFQENIPYVRGKDRRTLLTRKLAQRYRDISLAMALSLGTQEGARREERILFSSFTNTQQFQPWLAALKSNEAKLVGVFSLALIAPLVLKRLKLAAQRYVLVSIQEGGMRQSYVEDGKIRFSRLGRADPSDPRATAAACAAESDRILQYLINLRILPREAGPLDVVALAPAGHRDAYQAAWGDNPRLKLDFIDIESACSTAGLKLAPPGMLAERLFLHVLATTQPAEQFAGDTLRRHYHVWRAQLAMLVAGTAVCVFSLLLAGLRFLEMQQIDNQLLTQRQQEARVSREYDALQATFPKTPLPKELLKAAVETGGIILRQTRSPDRFLFEISQALAAVPQVELNKLYWAVSDRPPASADAAKAAQPTVPAAEAVGDGKRIFEVMEIDAFISGLKGTDYRAINGVVDQFVAALRQRPGIEVISRRTPFDALIEKPVAGDVGEADHGEVPTFSVRVSRRIDA